MVSVAQVRTVLRKGDWLASLDLKDAYWHVPIHPRFRRFLAFQVGTETFQFTRLPFGLSLAPRVFTKLVRVVASRLAEAGVPTLMYLDDWLLHAPSKEQVANNVRVARGVLEEMGFLLNIPKSSHTPTRKLCWLGIEWDSLSATLSLAPDNARRTLRHVRQAHFSRTFSHRQWESLLGSLNFAAPAMPLGRLKHRRLTLEVNLHLSPAHRDLPRQVSPSLHRLLRPWLRPGALRQRVPWVFPPPGITVATDASDVGWGYQSCLGHQRCGGWKEGERLLHINARELMVAKEWLNRHPQFARIGVRFDMDNVAAVQCLQKQGTVRSEILLSLSEQIFAIAAKRDIHLSARYVPGRENDWADALSRFRGTSVEWQLRPLVFESLCLRYGTPEVDLFASPSTALLPLFLTFSSRTEAEGPDAFTEDWNRWGHLYLFPPPATSVLLKAILKLRTFRGRVLLIAPLWPAQPWFGELSRWCPHPLQLGSACLSSTLSAPLQASLKLHAWSFYGESSAKGSSRRTQSWNSSRGSPIPPTGPRRRCLRITQPCLIPSSWVLTLRFGEASLSPEDGDSGGDRTSPGPDTLLVPSSCPFLPDLRGGPSGGLSPPPESSLPARLSYRLQGFSVGSPDPSHSLFFSNP
ncbi:hypothetical protein Pcinc_004790 [Petrolisthes cinctipes]|uniref:Reverse transcriptase domain-containing protein n=1 Tax=Petrolisthes cinctipes TaxID=88211 RepID=A0AAE1GGG4_PETCI|nr:hypothetical protein Pcinc_004790 [Petrolisthes cinctipes]